MAERIDDVPKMEEAETLPELGGRSVCMPLAACSLVALADAKDLRRMTRIEVEALVLALE